jgi:hypothetical protein
MNQHSNDDSSRANAVNRDARLRSQTLKGGHDPSELGRLSGEARREKARKRSEAAEHDALTVQARLGLAVAKLLTTAELERVISGLIERAKGHGHAANAAASQILSLAAAAAGYGEEADDIEGLDPEDMTPAQRATYRAQLDRVIEEMEQRMANGDAPPAESDRDGL